MIEKAVTLRNVLLRQEQIVNRCDVLRYFTYNYI